MRWRRQLTLFNALVAALALVFVASFIAELLQF